MSWRLPPRSSRWRWCLPELASSGATPAWRASWASEGKRSIGPISQSSFAALKGPQPANSSRRGASACVRACSSRSSSLAERVKVRRRASRSRAIRTCVVCSRRISCRASRSVQTARSSAPSGTVTVWPSSCRCQRNRCWQRRRSAHQVVAVVDEQLQLPQRLLAGARTVGQRLLQRSSCDGERVDLVGVAAAAAAAALRCSQPGWHPHQPLARFEQCPLQAARDVPAVLNRPQPFLLERPRPGHDLAPNRSAPLCKRATKLVDSNRGQRVFVYVHSDHDHSTRLQRQEGATGKRTDFNRGESHAPIRSRSTVSGRRGDTTLASRQKTDNRESSQPPPTRTLKLQPDDTALR